MTKPFQSIVKKGPNNVKRLTRGTDVRTEKDRRQGRIRRISKGD